MGSRYDSIIQDHDNSAVTLRFESGGLPVFQDRVAACDGKTVVSSAHWSISALGLSDLGSSARAMPESGNVHTAIAVIDAVDDTV